MSDITFSLGGRNDRIFGGVANRTGALRPLWTHLFSVITNLSACSLPVDNRFSSSFKRVAMASPTNRQVLLKSRPKGQPGTENFELVERPVPEPGEGQVLLRTL